MTNGQRSPGEPMALFGGTFDPVHYGHLRCADEVRRKLGLNTLYLLPAGTPPHRDTPSATVEQRLEMLQLARLEFPQLLIDDRETRRSGPSYMVDTLTEMRSSLENQPLLLLIGQDAANLLHTWFQWEQLFELAHIVILTRPGAPTKYPPELAKQVQLRSGSDMQELVKTEAGKVLHLEVESIDVYATGIKRILRSGDSPESMLPAAVLEYINKNRLYLAS
jgi:nicotinate-nucleotide adenylyltransferase